MKLLRYIADKLYKYSSYSKIEAPICYVKTRNIETINYELKVLERRNEEEIKRYMVLLMNEDIWKFVNIKRDDNYYDCEGKTAMYRGQLKIVVEG